LSGNKNFSPRTNHPSSRNKYFLIGKKISIIFMVSHVLIPYTGRSQIRFVKQI
jgi:hypothetical protein